MGKRVTTAELAKELGLSAYAVTTMRNKGILPFIKIGVGRGRIYYDIDLVNEALKKISEENAAKQAKLYDEYIKNKNSETFYPGILGR